MDLKKQVMRDVAGKCACQKLRKTTRIITRRYDEALKPVGIKGTQFTMLAVIAVVEDATLTELADVMGMERTTLLRNLKPLERDGLVAVSSGGGGRARSAEMTTKGFSILEKALPLWQDLQSRIKSEVGDDNWTDMQASLGALSATAQ